MSLTSILKSGIPCVSYSCLPTQVTASIKRFGSWLIAEEKALQPSRSRLVEWLPFLTWFESSAGKQPKSTWTRDRCLTVAKRVSAVGVGLAAAYHGVNYLTGPSNPPPPAPQQPSTSSNQSKEHTEEAHQKKKSGNIVHEAINVVTQGIETVTEHVEPKKPNDPLQEQEDKVTSKTEANAQKPEEASDVKTVLTKVISDATKIASDIFSPLTEEEEANPVSPAVHTGGQYKHVNGHFIRADFR